MFYHNDTRLTAMFPVNRYLHRENVCRSIKACGYERACQNFDSDRLLANAWKFRNGGVKLCPGGVWEWIHAVYWQDDLLGMLLAGGRRANPKLARKYPVYRSSSPPWQLPTGCDAASLPPVDEENNEDEFVMEGLRQLAARLQELGHRECEKNIGENRLSQAERLRLHIDRRYRNNGFNVESLAHHYHLSTSRMYHVIKQETGKSFKELVNEIRLTDARLPAGKLQFSDRPDRGLLRIFDPRLFLPGIQGRIRNDPAGVSRSVSAQRSHSGQPGTPRSPSGEALRLTFRPRESLRDARSGGHAVFPRLHSSFSVKSIGP
ncbi:MAG: hypothetical protein L6W00_03290 [Lentisphaeria bacterium]|nr:MAG: hypothetical protein L6W00_03290 [Lentisphaeria bacterium]